jgi:hypothetical protein
MKIRFKGIFDFDRDNNFFTLQGKIWAASSMEIPDHLPPPKSFSAPSPFHIARGTPAEE